MAKAKVKAAAKAKKTDSAVRTLVIVESPTKARTIRKFLGKNYVIESCMGHVRDLPKSAKDIPEKFKKKPWTHLGVNVDKGFDPIYCIPKTKTKVVKELKTKLKDAEELILATDEDREGESISWHLLEVLKPTVPVKRMVFHEITKTAIENALNNTRELNTDLVRAQEARRILDRLVGYTISPLIWKKVAYGLSAGRVQSVAVRLISEKEHDRIRFKKASYWGCLAQLKKTGTVFESKLVKINDKKIALGKDFDPETGQLFADKKDNLLHLEESQATKMAQDLKQKPWKVTSVETKPISRKPPAPFITSTLQQEANRKLGMASRETMEMAQKLYERGMITYMRTDSNALSQEAIEAARSCIENLYGSDYLPSEPRDYSKKKVKGAQEAHEAIRPAGNEFVKPEESGLSGGQLSLYDLIWKRTVAGQMVNSQHKQMKVVIQVGDCEFVSSGMTTEFPGFLKAYVEGADDPTLALQDKEVHLPSMKEGDELINENLASTSHETLPPARYTEASLVQTMEKEGIGRPSTYASIIGTIQDRGYVKKQGNALIPTFTALVVSQLLSRHLPNYVDPNFTSSMEKSLDDIAQGELEWIKYLTSVYHGDQGLKALVETSEENIDHESSKSIELLGLEDFKFRIGRYGAYVCRPDEEGGEVCASLQESHFPGDMTSKIANKLIDQKINGADALGKDPETDLPIYVLTGRYGPYVQRGDAEGKEAIEKPKRTSVPPMIDPETITLEQALQLLELPKTLGDHPETEKKVQVGLGRFGPYVVTDGDYRSIPKTDDLFEVDLTRALELLAQPKRGRGRSALRALGVYPETEDKVDIFNGKYGPYIKCGKVNVSVPESTTPEKITLEEAIDLLKEKMESKGLTKKKKKTAKKKVSKKGKKAGKKLSAKSASDDGDLTSKKATATKKKKVKKKAAKKKTKKKASGSTDKKEAKKKVIRRKGSSTSTLST